ncbi:MAG: hypothetical protein WCG27_04280, partial [Pseudomonadota bacterium]
MSVFNNWGKLIRAMGITLALCALLSSCKMGPTSNKFNPQVPGSQNDTSVSLAQNYFNRADYTASGSFISGSCSDLNQKVSVTGAVTASDTCTAGSWDYYVNFLTWGISDGHTYNFTVSHADSLGQRNTISKSIFTDFTLPTLSDVYVNTTSASGHIFKMNDTLDVRVSYSEPIQLQGTAPHLLFNFGSVVNRSATCSMVSSSTTELTCPFSVLRGDTSSGTLFDYASINALTATAFDMAMNPATVTLSAPGTGISISASQTYYVDGILPTVLNVTASHTAGKYLYKKDDQIDIQVNFSESVTITRTTPGSITYPVLALKTDMLGHAGDVIPCDRTTATQYICRYTVGDNDYVATPYYLNYPHSGAFNISDTYENITDLAGNIALRYLPDPVASFPLSLGAELLMVDGIAPYVASMTFTSTAYHLGMKNYKAGETVNFTANFSENIKMNGTGTATVLMNSPLIKNATCTLNTANLSCNYTVQSGDDVTNFNYKTDNALAVSNNATLTDIAGNTALLTLPDHTGLTSFLNNRIY